MLQSHRAAELKYNFSHLGFNENVNLKLLANTLHSNLKCSFTASQWTSLSHLYLFHQLAPNIHLIIALMMLRFQLQINLMI